MAQQSEMPLDEFREILTARCVDFEEAKLSDAIRFENSYGFEFVARNFGMHGVEICGPLTPDAAADATIGHNLSIVKETHPTDVPENMARYECVDCGAVWFQYEYPVRFCTRCGSRAAVMLID